MTTDKLKVLDKGAYEVCADCDVLLDCGTEWLGEDESGIGWYLDTIRCPECGKSKQEKRRE